MAANEIHKSDIGTIFLITVKDGTTAVDISGAATKQILFRKPDNSTLVTQTASFTTDGTDGKMQYTSVSGDLDTGGTWRIQVYLVIGGNEFRSDISTFEVHGNLE